MSDTWTGPYLEGGTQVVHSRGLTRHKLGMDIAMLMLYQVFVKYNLFSISEPFLKIAKLESALNWPKSERSNNHWVVERLLEGPRGSRPPSFIHNTLNTWPPSLWVKKKPNIK